MSLDSSVSTLTRLKARRPKYRGSILGWEKINVSSLMHTAGSVPGGRDAEPDADHSAIQCRYYFCMRLFKWHKREHPTSSVYLLPQNWSLSQRTSLHFNNKRYRSRLHLTTLPYGHTFQFYIFYNENQNDVVWLAFKWSALYQLSLRSSTRDKTEGRGENRTIVKTSERFKAFPKFF